MIALKNPILVFNQSVEERKNRRALFRQKMATQNDHLLELEQDKNSSKQLLHQFNQLRPSIKQSTEVSVMQTNQDMGEYVHLNAVSIQNMTPPV